VAVEGSHHTFPSGRGGSYGSSYFQLFVYAHKNLVLLVMVASLLEDGTVFRYCINARHLNRWWQYPSCLLSTVILHVMCTLINHGVPETQSILYKHDKDFHWPCGLYVHVHCNPSMSKTAAVCFVLPRVIAVSVCLSIVV